MMPNTLLMSKDINTGWVKTSQTARDIRNIKSLKHFDAKAESIKFQATRTYPLF